MISESGALLFLCTSAFEINTGELIHSVEFCAGCHEDIKRGYVKAYAELAVFECLAWLQQAKD